MLHKQLLVIKKFFTMWSVSHENHLFDLGREEEGGGGGGGGGGGSGSKNRVLSCEVFLM